MSLLASPALHQEVERTTETASNGAKTQPWPYITFPWRPDDFQLWWTTQIQPNFRPDKWRASILNMISCFLHSALLRTIYQGYLGVSYPPYIVSRIYLLFYVASWNPMYLCPVISIFLPRVSHRNNMLDGFAKFSFPKFVMTGGFIRRPERICPYTYRCIHINLLFTRLS